MTEETNVTPEIEKKQEENVTPQVAEQPKVDDAQAETPQQINWRKFREERERERKEKIESDRRAKQKEEEANALKAAMEALLNKPQQHQQTQQEYEQEESESDRVKRLVKEELQKERDLHEADRRTREQAEMPRRLATNLQDFDNVCTTENLDYLEFHYPEVAAAFKQLPDNYDKWANIYHAVKRFVPNGTLKDKAKAERNMSKPQSMSVPGVTSTGDQAPMMLTDQKRADNWKRMSRVMRGG